MPQHCQKIGRRRYPQRKSPAPKRKWFIPGMLSALEQIVIVKPNEIRKPYIKKNRVVPKKTKIIHGNHVRQRFRSHVQRPSNKGDLGWA